MKIYIPAVYIVYRATAAASPAEDWRTAAGAQPVCDARLFFFPPSLVKYRSNDCFETKKKHTHTHARRTNATVSRVIHIRACMKYANILTWRAEQIKGSRHRGFCVTKLGFQSFFRRRARVIIHVFNRDKKNNNNNNSIRKYVFFESLRRRPKRLYSDFKFRISEKTKCFYDWILFLFPDWQT